MPFMWVADAIDEVAELVYASTPFGMGLTDVEEEATEDTEK